MKFSYHKVKESYETLKSQVQSLEGRLSKYIETIRFLETKYKGKQLVLNQYIDELAEVITLRHTFSTVFSTSHQMIMIKGHWIRISSEVVSKVVESFLKEDSTKNDKYESKVEDEESFHKNYLKNSKSEKDENDYSISLAYYMVGSDKLFSDIEFLIQNVIMEKIEKVVKLVEIEKSEIDKFFGKASKKGFYNKPSYKKKNTKLGLGYKKKQNQKKRSEKSKFQKNMNFVHEQALKKKKKSDLVDSLMTNYMLRKRNNNRLRMFRRKHVLNVNKLDTLLANVQI
ncbi:hypothetical protein Hanom_Chr07g00628531 [Helianthus anomalus]